MKEKGKEDKHKHHHHNLLHDVDTTGMSEEEIAKLEAEAVLRKYDKESAHRVNLSRPNAILIAVLLTAFAVFQIYTTIWTIPIQVLRPVHLAFILALAYLLYPAKATLPKDRIPWYDYALAALALAAMLYIPLNYEYVIRNVGNFNWFDITVGVVGILLLLGACHRVVGLPIMIVVGVFLLYAFFGYLIPGTFGIRQMKLKQIINHMFYTTSGVFGTPLGVSSTYIFLFVLFGAFLEKTGVGKLFIDLANALAGRRVGGPAKVAVIASALEGTVSGSSVANTVGSGSFTIPAMKRLGYKPEFAAAVEAAASTGGQIMPPVMGAAAFLMAESTGFAYSAVVKAAIIPAILYFSGILISVHHEARKIGLRGMSAEELPKVGQVLRERGHLLLPLLYMIYVLSTNDITASYAALGAILASLMAHSIGWWSLIPLGGMIVSMHLNIQFAYYALGAIAVWMLICLFRRRLGFDPRDILDALQTGARNVLAVGIACAMAGMIVGTVTLTGLGLKFATGLKMLAGDSIYLMMFFTMLASIVLGMGVPTTANYLITSTICAPAMISIICGMRGIDPTAPTMAIVMSAHMFVFYFGIVADITPPVALAAMAGSAIAKGDPMKTGVTATRLAIGAFIVPYIFVLNPAMLLIETHPLEIVQNVITALLGMYALSGGLTGFVQDHCRWYEVVLLLGSGICMIIPGTLTDLIGLAILVLVFVTQRIRYQRRQQAGAAL